MVVSFESLLELRAVPKPPIILVSFAPTASATYLLSPRLYSSGLKHSKQYRSTFLAVITSSTTKGIASVKPYSTSHPNVFPQFNRRLELLRVAIEELLRAIDGELTEGEVGVTAITVEGPA
ncbi:hypothetical protein GOBAR_AA07986 [Gossypium barbadense]|uniref:Uncharacterized protein n=1 Tax=Gossypium barbadense TaxID=3634 RepID=A0A2P5YAM4_GOSBA|nr:hypothetical protein GOBAR_AA07986 [Gossypium barbadense]